MPDMMTPDGRVVSVPDGFEGHFAGLSLPPAPEAQPPSVTQPGLGVPAAALDVVPSQRPPELSVVPQLSPDAPVMSPDGGGQTLAQAFPHGDAALPQPAPQVTQRDIATMGEAGPLNAEIGALDKAKEAAQRLGTAQANQAIAVGAVEAAANDEADRQLAQIKANAEANAKAVQDATDAYVRNAQSLANVRVDRSIDHPILAAVGTALNILGTAMKKADMSQVMKPVYDAIDRKVSAQMQDIELGRANLGLQRESLALLRQSGNDKMTLQQTLMLSSLEQAKRRVQEIKDKSTSPIVKAQADQAMADIDARQAGAIGTYQARYQQRQDAAAARAQAERLAKMQISVTMRGQDIQAAENDANRRERAQEHIDNIAEKLMLAGNAKAAERAKMLKDNGILDPVTHEYMLTSAGQAKMAQADSMEAQVRKDPTPVAKAYIAKITDKTQADQLTEAIKNPKIAAQVAQQYANDIRNDAQINDTAIVRGAVKPDKIQEELATAHEVQLSLDTAQKMLEQDPSSFDRKAWAALQAQLMVTNANYVKTLGERVSVKALEAFNGVMSIDPESLTSRTIDKGKGLEAIKALKTANAQQADVTLGKAGIKTSWKPGSQGTDTTDIFAGKTAQELARDAEPGAWKGDIRALAAKAAGLSSTSRQDEALNAAMNRRGAPSDAEIKQARKEDRDPIGDVSNYGLDPKVDDNVRSLIKQSSTVGHDKYSEIVSTLARPLTTTNRPGLDTGVAKLIRDTDPRLYEDVIAKVATDAGQSRAEDLVMAISIPAVKSIDLSPTPSHKRVVVPGAVQPEPVR
jgi:hypothetical protein